MVAQYFFFKAFFLKQTQNYPNTMKNHTTKFNNFLSMISITK